MSPSGWMTPITMSTARPRSSAGVRNLPMMSMTADSRTLNARMTAKNSAENSTGLRPGISCVTPISNVVAAVRGMASIGPMQRMITVMSTVAALAPMRSSTRMALPSLKRAKSATSASATSAI